VHAFGPCEWCGQRFSRENLLIAHLQTQHAEQYAAQLCTGTEALKTTKGNWKFLRQLQREKEELIKRDLIRKFGLDLL